MFKNNMIYLIIIILFIAIFECIAQGCLKKYYNNPLPANKYLYFLAICAYSIICLLLIQSYNYKTMGLVNVLWSGISVLVILSLGVFYFGEKITTLDKIGVGLVLVGISFIVYENN